jgi:hypothetical protein
MVIFGGWIADAALSARGAFSSTRKLVTAGVATIALILLHLA